MRFNEVDEVHCRGAIEISEDFKQFPHDMQDVDLGIQIAPDGRLWLCVNGIACIRFKPAAKELFSIVTEELK
jgi:streptogramin lyase